MSEMSYLEKLLDGVDVEWLPLSDLARIRNGKDHKSLSEGEFRFTVQVESCDM